MCTQTHIHIPGVKIVCDKTRSKPYLLPVHILYLFLNQVMQRYCCSSSLNLFNSFSPYTEMQKLCSVRIQGYSIKSIKETVVSCRLRWNLFIISCEFRSHAFSHIISLSITSFSQTCITFDLQSPEVTDKTC